MYRVQESNGHYWVMDGDRAVASFAEKSEAESVAGILKEEVRQFRVAAKQGLIFSVLVLGFLNQDEGTDRLPGTLNLLREEAKITDMKIRSVVRDAVG